MVTGELPLAGSPGHLASYWPRAGGPADMHLVLPPTESSTGLGSHPSPISVYMWALPILAELSTPLLNFGLLTTTFVRKLQHFTIYNKTAKSVKIVGLSSYFSLHSGSWIPDILKLCLPVKGGISKSSCSRLV